MPIRIDRLSHRPPCRSSRGAPIILISVLKSDSPVGFIPWSSLLSAAVLYPLLAILAPPTEYVLLVRGDCNP